MARLKAEADAQDSQNRLRVAQEQLAEYAAQRHADTSALEQQAAELRDALASALSTSGGSEALKAEELKSVSERMEALAEKISDLAAESRAFASQSKADVDTLKRSNEKVRATDSQAKPPAQGQGAMDVGVLDVAERFLVGPGFLGLPRIEVPRPLAHRPAATPR